MAFTVTITQTGSTAAGTDLLLKVITGQAVSPIGAKASATSTTPSLAITPNGNGSLVYGANLGLSGTYTPNAATTYQLNHSGQGLEYIGLRSTATTTAGTPVTLGGTAGVNSIAISLLEILAGPGAGGLAEDPSAPPAVSNTVLAATTALFSPPAGSLLVLMAITNGGSGIVSVTVTDTSGLSLKWLEQGPQHGTGNGYAGVWIAQMPPAASFAAAQFMPPGRMSPGSWQFIRPFPLNTLPATQAHQVTASLSVTPATAATASRGHSRAAALTVTPGFTAVPAHGHYRHAALTVTPGLTAARSHGNFRAASLAITPSLAAVRVRGAHRGASLALVPQLAAARTRGRYRTAAVTVAPEFLGEPKIIIPVPGIRFRTGAARILWRTGAARTLWSTGGAKTE